MGQDANASQLSPLKQAYLALEKMQAKLEAVEANKHQPIAIIGIGCRFPGGVNNTESYWNLLRDGVDAVTEIPSNRWNVPEYYDPNPDAPGKTSSRGGGFIEQIDQFDAKFFGIAPREANSMDPQQRLLLEVAWEALENAGLATDQISSSRTGVFVGMTNSDYSHLFTKADDLTLMDAYYASGIAHSIASGRLSYILGLQGPSLTIDTACSSSLVAIHLAVQSLRSGECNLALAGGVNLILTPDINVALSKYGMLAPDGRCKTFDAGADGYGRGEGCGIIVLKRLSDAITDGDSVMAVIRGTAVNQDGASTGLTAPNGIAQEAVITEALANGGVEPGQVSYVEAHGTGTPLGDPIEVQALARALRSGTLSQKPLAIGSVKTNFGHLESAAGIAAVIKAVLVLQHKEIPPHLHLNQRNPFVDWDKLSLTIPTERTPLTVEDHDGIVGVSSFGFSGTNAHIVLEAASVQAAPAVEVERPLQILTLSGHTEGALRDLAAEYSQYLSAHSGVSFADVSFTANTGRAHFDHRVAIIAGSAEQAQEQLSTFAAGEPSNIITGLSQNTDKPKIAFLFTGQGAQYAGMGRGLYETQPTFRVALDRCAQILEIELEHPLLSVLFPEDGAPAYLDDTTYTQPALFALEYALAQLWMSWGIQPSAVMGHSVGEYVAACIAGVFSLEDGLKLIAQRSKLMGALKAGGTMMAVLVDEAKVREAVSPFASSVSVAAVNGEDNVVISGREVDVQAIVNGLKAEGIKSRRLTVSHAFHSPLMDTILNEFEAAAAQIQFNRPRIRLISNLTGKVAGAEITKPDYWRRHLREPVQFAASIHFLNQQNYELFVEIGPGTTLLGMGQRCVEGAEKPGLWLPSLRSGKDDWVQILDTLAKLYIYGVKPNWKGFDAGYPRQKLSLPCYPFQRVRHWMPKKKHVRVLGGDIIHPLLGYRLRSPLKVVQFENHIRADDFGFLSDHRVKQSVILPATGYIEMAMAAAHEVFKDGGTLQDIIIRDSLVADGETRTAQFVVTAEDENQASFEYLSTGEAGEDWRLHATGTLLAEQPTPAEGDSPKIIQERCTQTVTADEHYDYLRQRGAAFGESLHGVVNIWRRDGEALGEIRLPNVALAEAGNYFMHPAMLDACLQIVVWAIPSNEHVYMPMSIERYTLYRHPGTAVWSHVVIRPDSDPQSGAMKADVRVQDETGVVAEIEGIYFRSLSGTAQKPVFADWLYEIDWESRPLNGQVRGFFPLPTTLAERAKSGFAGLVEHHHLDRFIDGLLPELESLSIDYILLALNELGWKPRVGDILSPSALASQHGIAPQHERLFRRLFGMMVEAGILKNAGAAWEVREVRAAGNPRLHCEALIEEYPEHLPELTLTAWCGDNLAAALSGQVDGVSLLFQDGGEKAGQMYMDSPSAHVFNSLLVDTLKTGLPNRPAGHMLRVLEIGAGTGGTTAFILPVLPADQTTYTYTDISPVLVEKAKEKFEAYSFVHYQVLNIEEDPAGQGLAGQEFDLIVAANVIHATADLRQTLAHVRQLLAPEGTLMMVEITSKRQRWLDITFGLTDGWWRFTDSRVVTDYPLLNQSEWFQVLSDNGFTEVAAVPDADTSSALSAVLIARGPAKQPESLSSNDTGEWLILADQGGVGQHLADRLRERGGTVSVISASSVDVSDPDVLKPLVTEGLRNVVHLWSFDLEAPDDSTIHSLLPNQHLNTGSLLFLVQALGGTAVSPRLWIATQGASALGGEIFPVQATTWGLGKVIALEHPEFKSVCIDLDPALDTDVRADMLLAEITAPDAETQVAYHGQVRYAARLSRKTIIPVPPHPQPFYVEKPVTGVLDDITLIPTERRAPGAGQVEIEVYAAGLNLRDVMNALAMRADAESLGGECSGKIVAVGEGVEGLEVGDDVIAIARGCFSTFVTTDAELVLHKPRNMSYESAGAFPLAFLTAHYALNHMAKLSTGERVLIHAAAGGVGMAAVQLAQQVGAVIFGTAGTPEKRALLSSMGVQHVLDSRSLNFTDEIMTLTNGEGVDVVLNSLAGEFIPASLSALAPEGRFLEIGKRDIWTAEDVKQVKPNASYFIIDLSPSIHSNVVFIRSMFTELLDAVQSGLFTETPITTFPMQDAADAFRYMAQANHTGKIVLTLDESRRASGLTIRPHASYLITGGLAGLGLLTARWLVEQGARHLVLVGRGAATEDALGVIATMEQLGVEVRVAQADVSQADQIGAVLDDMGRRMPPLRGIIHSAGALADGALMRQDWAHFLKPMRAKVDGTWNLHSLTLDQPLDFFVMYSSVASLLGSTGQGNHAAANAFMDALAYYRHSHGLPAISINWGPWAEIGAAVEYNVSERITAQGIDMIPPEYGLQVLNYLMVENAPQVGVSLINWTTFMRQFFTGGVPLWLSKMVAEVKPVKASLDKSASQKKVKQAELLEQIEKASPNEQYNLLMVYVSDQAAKVLGVASGEAVDPAMPLNQMGLDSLMAVELRNRLTASLGLKRNLPATLVFDYPTVEALASYIFQNVLALGSAVQPPRPKVEAVDTLSSIEELSDEEVDRLLKNMRLQ